MSLSNELVSQFVEVTRDIKKDQVKTTMQGTVVYNGGKLYVKLDGSDVMTPVVTTVSVGDGNRVSVSIENHKATITGNLSDPSAGNVTVSKIGNKIQEFDVALADKVSTTKFEAEIGRIDQLVTENATVIGELQADHIVVDEIVADNASINEKLTTVEADIKTIKTEKLDATVADTTYATIENLEAIDEKVYNLEGVYGEFHDLTVERLDTNEADISDLKTNKLDASVADIKYANVDFANINMAAVEKLFSDSGIIKDLIVSEGKITGELVGVTIKGDLIEGNTVVADKLVVKGQNGLYYKLNTDGVTTESEQTDYNSLNGTVIKAKSITAEKIAVDDLVAFGATIGGFNITASAIFSGVKTEPLNTTSGVYLDNIGQFSVGDSNQYIRYYKNEEDQYVLEISAEATIITASGKSVATAIDALENQMTSAEAKISENTEATSRSQETADSAQETASTAESLIRQLADNIAALVTDGNGTSLMTQTDDGWAFSTYELQKSVNTTSEGLASLIDELGNTNNIVSILQQAVDDLGILSDYITIGTYEDQPCIELGETDSDFKLRITNTQVVYTEGSIVLAYFTNQSMHIKKAVIEEELQQGGFVWKVRSNGNIGLVWKGVSS